MTGKNAMKSSSYVKLLGSRESNLNFNRKFQAKLHVTDTFIARLGLEKELEGHGGCVNCLEWNASGSILASASDDLRVFLWNPFSHKRIHSFETGHRGNIFTVKFLPDASDHIIVTGAGDSCIRLHDVEAQETVMACRCHMGRVKRITTAPHDTNMFWSASEDGTVMEFDRRINHHCTHQRVLINLVPHLGHLSEVKCVAINPQRPELIAVGANDPYIRVYDRRVIRPLILDYTSYDSLPKTSFEKTENLSRKTNNLPPACVQYYVAGHLPAKYQDYKKIYRNLATTYLTFSSDGNELLVNIGGEQIYLFDINSKRRPKTYDFQLKDVDDHCCNGYTTGMKNPNGFERSTNGLGYGPQSMIGSSKMLSKPPKNTMNPNKVVELKLDANYAFEMTHYTTAIRLYNEAIRICSNWALLYGNRAAAYMKRNWDGDLYAALRDCNITLQLDPNHIKAHFRLAKCLFDLKLVEEACTCLTEFKIRFPDQSHSRAFKALDMDIQTASQTNRPAPDLDEDTITIFNAAIGASKIEDSHIRLSSEEITWRQDAFDYSSRFCGHCNTTTDIKEANFFGSEGQYIVAGSDDGSFFIWDRLTTNIVQVLKGDESIVNCLQPHPTSCLLATSGIDPVVRLWSPLSEDGRRNERAVLNTEDAATANQRRMNADPFEVMLLNMGYRIAAAAGDGELDRDEPFDSPSINCRPS